ncbi:MAG TPA: type I-C CRISPR-associated endonuclease Cas1 [Clostridiaceae bacterium]|nr:type I-C CRISPR-associated endonuclease Cas1 [Clostridiaceae bacterium]
MKKLLNTLFVSAPDRYLSLDGENVVIQAGEKEIGRVPLHNLESIVTFGYTGASPALMGACASRNISLSFMTSHGRFLARVTGEVKGNVTLRREQYRVADDPIRSIKIARNIITAKIYNSKWIIERAIRDYPLRLDIEKLRAKSKMLSNSLHMARNAINDGDLRGIEGEAASLYFSVFDNLILQQKDEFKFNGRTKRPPLDKVNAMLSFAYTMLAGMYASALETVGLDPYVGFFHRDRPGRISLALDLMEELRSVFADRFVLTIINKRIINERGFMQKENGAVYMDDKTRKDFLSAWQSKKQEIIIHPFLEEKVEWGMVPYVQSMLLARYIRGDLDEYPPFFWK